MIDLHYTATPNGHKVRVFLEEAGLAYRVIPVDLAKGEQRRPEFLAISPNGRIPAIVDHAPSGCEGYMTVFESGAILLYLAEKTGLFLPAEPRARLEVLQWLFWQMAGLGPMAGQIGHFNVYASEKLPYAIERYRGETARLYGVLDRRLADRAYIGGDYSIADMACFPWIVPHSAHGQRLQDYPNILRWFEAIRARAAVVRAYGASKDVYTGRPLQSSQTPLSGARADEHDHELH
jgi:GST-like protein